eukprot:COSAG01_NODE_316_length_19004_cov_100.001322_3_plen_172_part_00
MGTVHHNLVLVMLLYGVHTTCGYSGAVEHGQSGGLCTVLTCSWRVANFGSSLCVCPSSNTGACWTSSDNIDIWLDPILELYEMIGVDTTDVKDLIMDQIQDLVKTDKVTDVGAMADYVKFIFSKFNSCIGNRVGQPRHERTTVLLGGDDFAPPGLRNDVGRHRQRRRRRSM